MPIVKRIFYIFACVFAIAFNSIAQEKTKVVVNGLQICDTYTRTQMYEALGGVPEKQMCRLKDKEIKLLTRP